MRLKNKPGSQKKAAQKKRKREERKGVIAKRDFCAASTPSNFTKQDIVGTRRATSDSIDCLTGKRIDSSKIQVLKNLDGFSGLPFSGKLNYLRKAHPGSEVECFTNEQGYIVVDISPGPTCPVRKNLLFTDYQKEVVMREKLLESVLEVGVEATVAKYVALLSIADPESVANLVRVAGLGIEAMMVAWEKLRPA